MEAETPAQVKRGISRQLSGGDSGRRSGRFSFKRNLSFNPHLNRFSFGRQSSLDPHRECRSPTGMDELTVPENLDSTMQLLFLASLGDSKGVEELLKDGVDVNSIDLDGRTALHIAACEGNVDVVKLLLSWRANVDARDRWGSTAAVDAKYYGNVEVYNVLKARGAKVPKIRRTPMAVSNPGEVPEYELNPGELQFRRGEEVLKGTYQVAKWNGTKVSVKILDKDSHSDPDSVNAFKHELNLLQKARHPNVIQFVGAVTQNIPMMIAVEYHPKSDLGSYLQKKGRLQPHKALRYALEIARGMNYLHQCKPDPIIHCNLKPKNILLDYGGQLKVAGFGVMNLLKVSPDKVKLDNGKAQIDNFSLYTAPEIYRDEEFDVSVDAFSFGLILYEMIEGAPAFHPKSPEEASKMICLDRLRPPLKNKSKSYPQDVKELIEECWNPEPVIRPTFSEIIIRLDKVYSICAKQGRWKDTFKLPWK
ncbi:integrin-linked protein kinase 1-like [Curcuma longa]|uniref:integrin-linked protein kinase 1-like n=1 Tax=Curcuma longa TaxID=136217 RepID=UPI003D9ECEE9